jgi:hypothetical protein
MSTTRDPSSGLGQHLSHRGPFGADSGGVATTSPVGQLRMVLSTREPEFDRHRQRV